MSYVTKYKHCTEPNGLRIKSHHNASKLNINQVCIEAKRWNKILYSIKPQPNNHVKRSPAIGSKEDKHKLDEHAYHGHEWNTVSQLCCSHASLHPFRHLQANDQIRDEKYAIPSKPRNQTNVQAYELT